MKEQTQNYCRLYAFFKAIRGNWRNAIYVSCDQVNCPYGHKPACSGYLMIGNENGQPLVISEADYIRITGEAIEPAECKGTLTRQAFECMYAQYVYWNVTSVQDCPLSILKINLDGCNKNN